MRQWRGCVRPVPLVVPGAAQLPGRLAGAGRRAQRVRAGRAQELVLDGLVSDVFVAGQPDRAAPHPGRTEGQRGGHLRAGRDAARGQHRAAAGQGHDLRGQHHGGDRPGVAARLGPLRDQQVHPGGQLALGVPGAARPARRPRPRRRGRVRPGPGGGVPRALAISAIRWLNAASSSDSAPAGLSAGPEPSCSVPGRRRAGGRPGRHAVPGRAGRGRRPGARPGSARAGWPPGCRGRPATNFSGMSRSTPYGRPPVCSSIQVSWASSSSGR